MRRMPKHDRGPPPGSSELVLPDLSYGNDAVGDLTAQDEVRALNK